MRRSRLLVSVVAVGFFLSMGVACSKKGPSSSVDTETNSALKRIHFDFDKYNIRGDAVSILKQNASWMKDHPKKNIIVEGHCDERGTSAYNLVLGEKRAKAARNYLVELGVSANRLGVVSYGKERPFCKDHSEACYAQNRRGHVVVKSGK